MRKGVAASPGIIIGKAFVYHPGKILLENKQIEMDSVDSEVVRFEQALSNVQQEFARMHARSLRGRGRGKGPGFQAQLSMLDDPTFKSDVIAEIRGGTNAETAVSEVFNGYIDLFRALRDPYLKERAADLKDIGYKIKRHLMGNSESVRCNLEEDSIVLARDLSPSDTLQMGRSKIIGMATEGGGRTSHTSIMARSMDIPAVVGLGPFLSEVQDGDCIVIDGSQGVILINPDDKNLSHYKKRMEAYRSYKNELESLRNLPAETRDGHQITLLSNIDHPVEVAGAIDNGSQGVGLFRTEYHYLGREEPPGEEEQYLDYRKVAEDARGAPVIIRTIDIGGDNAVFFLPASNEANPFLGWRGIRMSLDLIEVFKTQLKAILRASAHGKIKMMFPMVSNLDELRWAKEVLAQAKRELEAEGKEYECNIEIGILVEVPSVAITIDLFVNEVDFFSIGTNDLVQYTMAVDRNNEKVSSLYEPLNPAVLRLIQQVVDVGSKANKEVSLCGEMAGEPLTTVLLVGMGLNVLSTGPSIFPEVKKRIRSVTMAEAREIARKALQFSTASEVRKFLEVETRSHGCGLYF